MKNFDFFLKYKIYLINILIFLGLFTSECSALWPKFNFIPFLITQPPFTVIPFLLFMPVIDWLQLLPGDLPMCFLCCIQVLLQCKGIKFSDIPQCGSLYTLDTLLRAIFDLALLVFLGLSMVPGLCTYNPFIINMWMIPPRLMSEEEKMLRKAPKLKELLKKTQKDPSFSDLGEGDCGNKDNKEEFPFGSPEDLLKGIQENGPNETTEGLEEPKDNWGIREIEGDYIAEHWEKNLAPENSIGNNFERKLIAGGKNSESSSGKVHETQKEKIDIVGERGKKSVSGDMGQREWEYPIGE